MIIIRPLFFLFLMVLAVGGQERELESATFSVSQGVPARAYSTLAAISLEGDQEAVVDLALARLETGLRSGVVDEEAYEYLSGLAEPPAVLQYWDAHIALFNGEWSQALDLFLQVSMDDQHSYRVTSLVNAARLHLAFGNPQAAREALELTGVEEQVPYLFDYTRTLIETGESAKARDLLTAIMPADKVSLQRDLLIALSYSAEEAGDQALEHLSELKVDASTVQSRRVLYTMSQYLTAEEQGKKYILQAMTSMGAGDPCQLYIEQYLSCVEQLADPLSEVKQQLESLLEQSPTEVRGYYYYALAQIETDDRKKLSLLKPVFQSGMQELNAVACYEALRSAVALDSEEEAKLWMQLIIEACKNEGLQSKAYSLIAGYSDQDTRPMLLKRALERATLEQAEVLKLNYNLALLVSGIEFLEPEVMTLEKELQFMYEMALYRKKSFPAEAIFLLEEYLTRVSQDERKAEAHLTLAELFAEPGEFHNPSLAQDHLDTIAALYLDNLPTRERYDLVLLQLAVEGKDEQTLEGFIMKEDASPEYLMEAGFILYNVGEAYKASTAFKAVLELSEISERERELAQFYLALSYLNLGTAAHIESAVERLEQLIRNEEGTFVAAAKGLLARCYFNNTEIDKALSLLADLPNTIDNRLLCARCYMCYRDQDSLDTAQRLLDELLRESEMSELMQYQVAYQFILFLEERKNDDRLVELYYQVLNVELLDSPTSDQTWELYDRVARRALAFLEDKGQWRSAHQLATSMALRESPYSQSYQEHAKELSLKYILWDED